MAIVRFPRRAPPLAAALVGALVLLAQAGLVVLAFSELGLRTYSALLFLITALLANFLKLPLFRFKTNQRKFKSLPLPVRQAIRRRRAIIGDEIAVKANVGGALLPLLVAVQFFVQLQVQVLQAVLGAIVVAILGEIGNQPMFHVGKIPTGLAFSAIGAGLVARTLAPDDPTALAYVCATAGTIVGALMSLSDARNLGKASITIGAHGVMDVIFLAGPMAVLLA